MSEVLSPSSIKDIASNVLDIEANAIIELKQRLNDSFEHACQHILHCQGRLIVIGMGKSGHIGKKIAATLASTGTPAFFVHPSEASHGDMGMITAKDVTLIISNSGETPEIVALLPFLKRLNTSIIAMTGNTHSTLSKASNHHLNIAVSQEACPLGLAPTTSTTACLVMGDALAVVLLKMRGFTSNDFALFHPAGALGKRLLLRTQDLMHSGKQIPVVEASTSLREALYEMTSKQLGMTTICDNQGQLQGIFTDGDLRRTLDNNVNIHTTLIHEVMTTTCQTISATMLAVEALNIMQHNKITSLVVTDNHQVVKGILHLHDLLQAGVA
ncbi:MAG: D-arabinose 5-phosphate isomerase [Coxiellaceae bacterium]|nr:D-arabinose 5-phosphate isomerase [Coxiellaceae bacterium]|tara:strand:+ start:2225 stop:3208 length:984 start_codon:yes stop_codon:yes gene_type:complete